MMMMMMIITTMLMMTWALNSTRCKPQTYAKGLTAVRWIKLAISSAFEGT